MKKKPTIKRRRSLTRAEQVTTITAFMAKKKFTTQTQFLDWLCSRGILISPGYLSDAVNGRKLFGPAFKDVFREITGVTLVDGLIEEQQ